MPTSTPYLRGSASCANGCAASCTPPIQTCRRPSNGRVQPYFVLKGNVCALLATKDHVNLFVYDGAIVPTRTAS